MTFEVVVAEDVRRPNSRVMVCSTQRHSDPQETFAAR